MKVRDSGEGEAVPDLFNPTLAVAAALAARLDLPLAVTFTHPQLAAAVRYTHSHSNGGPALPFGKTNKARRSLMSRL